MNTFFVDKPKQELLLFRNLLGRVHSYSSPHFIWPSSWPDWRTLFVKLHTDTFFSAKFDNDMGELFVDNPDHFFSFSDSTGKHTLLFWPSFHLKSFDKIEKHFLWTCIPTFFWAQSLTTTWIIFFVNKPDQKILLFRNLLGRVHSYSSPHFIWPSSWPDWRTLFVKLHTDTFLSAKFDNDMS